MGQTRAEVLDGAACGRFPEGDGRAAVAYSLRGEPGLIVELEEDARHPVPSQALLLARREEA
ncbi:hypothetical protein [Streptomyces sp. SH5]|uniref:hypothetical protein n=1 Tax=Streptomyces sp. SH5 TaxID=3041765 RepID=UPI002477D7B6|nr:hypothetical protein [Streptomyces sp. SH5]WGP09864.1 hypothetical protein QFA72_09295 [Streptomyces sp. SH5]